MPSTRNNRRQRGPQGGLRVTVCDQEGDSVPDYLWEANVIQALTRTLAGAEPEFLTVVDEFRFIVEPPVGVDPVELGDKLRGIDNWLGCEVHIESEVITSDEVDRIKLETVDQTARGNRGRNQNPARKVSNTSSTGSGSGSRKTPKLGWFSGEPEKGKEFVGYPQWKYSVRQLLKNHDEEDVKEAIVGSLRKSAFDLVRYMDENANVHEVLEKLDTFYGITLDYDSMMATVFNSRQSPQETVVGFATHLEGLLNDVRVHYPRRLTPESMREHLRDRLFKGLKAPLRRSLQHWYDDSDVTYEDLLKQAIKAEGDANSGRGDPQPSRAKMVRPAEDEEEDEPDREERGKAKSAEVKGASTKDSEESGLAKLVKEIEDLKSKVAAATTRPNDQNRNNDGQRRIMRRAPTSKDQCHRCKGYGHFAFQCATPLNTKVEAENGTPPPPQKRDQ